MITAIEKFKYLNLLEHTKLIRVRSLKRAYYLKFINY